MPATLRVLAGGAVVAEQRVDLVAGVVLAAILSTHSDLDEAGGVWNVEAPGAARPASPPVSITINSIFGPPRKSRSASRAALGLSRSTS